LEQVEPKVLHRIHALASVWNTVKQGMLAAVYGPGGTARLLADLPIKVAGKTGSSEHRKGAKTHAWFIAFAPADNPQIALCVMVEEAGHGGEVAVPIAKQILQAFASKLRARRHRYNFCEPLNLSKGRNSRCPENGGCQIGFGPTKNGVKLLSAHER
jgi:penicillin-binding protein 2